MQKTPSFDSTSTHAHAQCLCGAVQLRARLPSLWLSHCHCTLCQRAHGAALVTWVGLDEAGCQIDDRDGVLRWYRSTPPAQRGFCTRCGTPLLFKSTRWPDELHVVVANFTTPLDRAPQAHTHWETRVAWCAVDPNDALPRHRSEPQVNPGH